MPGAVRPDGAALISTHISHVVLLGDRAYKIRRPVRFPFLDLSTPERRLEDCERELRLNRRLAPDVYLGIGRFVGPDGEEEPVVVMRRMPMARCLTTLVGDGPSPQEALAAVAHRLAAFHEAADEVEGGSSALLTARWRSNLDEIRRFVPDPLSAHRHRGIGVMSERYLMGRGPLLQHRREARRIRDGHGDVKADDIFCLDDGPRILDCLEFDDTLRHLDVIEDAASLAMDLERLGRPDLSGSFLDHYEADTNDHPPASLVHHYIAYRALVRAKVACLTAEEGRPGAADEARLLFAMAHTHLERGTVRLVLVGGLPGTGKTTLSRALCEAQGWTMLSTDALRREIFGPHSPPASYGGGIYDPASKQRVYAEMLRKTRSLLAMGESVVLDASWSREVDRVAAREVACETSSVLTELVCRSTRERAEARIRSRRLDPMSLSEATPETARLMAQAFDAWQRALPVDTSGRIDEVVDELFRGPLSAVEPAAHEDGPGVAGELVADRT